MKLEDALQDLTYHDAFYRDAHPDMVYRKKFHSTINSDKSTFIDVLILKSPVKEILENNTFIFSVDCVLADDWNVIPCPKGFEQDFTFLFTCGNLNGKSFDLDKVKFLSVMYHSLSHPISSFSFEIDGETYIFQHDNFHEVSQIHNRFIESCACDLIL